MRTGRLCRIALDQPDRQPNVLLAKYLSGLMPCAWPRDGKYVLFREDPDFSASVAADGLELFRIPSAGGAAVSLKISSLVHDDMISLSPDGTLLAVSAGGGRMEWEEKRIAVIDSRTATLRYLTDRNMVAVCPAWSPGGDRIAFASAPGSSANIGGGEEAKRLLARRRIWVSGISAGSVSRQLTHDDRFRDEEPMWSADGRYLLFCRVGGSGAMTLWLMNAEGGDLQQAAGPLYIDPGNLGENGSWFGYYGYTTGAVRSIGIVPSIKLAGCLPVKDCASLIDSRGCVLLRLCPGRGTEGFYPGSYYPIGTVRPVA